MNKGTPTVTEMQVIPVAGYDSMLMTLSGCHAPYFTRNLVILKDSAGHTGIGEIHGGDYTCEALKSCIPLVVGQQVGKYRSILDSIHKASRRAKEDDGEGIQSLDISKLKFVVKAEWAIECALLDLLGQYLDLPMCELLGDGKQRDQVETLGYLFYVSDKNKAKELNYLDESDSSDPWFKLRRQEMLTPERIVEQAQVLHEKYGFRNFKLKGGVLAPKEEVKAVAAIKEAFPEARVDLDPNGCWSLKEALEVAPDLKKVLAYCEDPCGAEDGFSGREVMAEFRKATMMPTATNMINTDWRQMCHAIALQSVDIPLADPHFWTMEGSVRVGQLCNDFGLMWGCHSNNHFDISLAMVVQCAAAIPGKMNGIDTHWIWQEGRERLTKEPMQIVGGCIELPKKPGLGVEVDRDQIMKAHQLYMDKCYGKGARNDAVGMQYLIPGWTFDNKKPCMVR